MFSGTQKKILLTDLWTSSQWTLSDIRNVLFQELLWIRQLKIITASSLTYQSPQFTFAWRCCVTVDPLICSNKGNRPLKHSQGDRRWDQAPLCLIWSDVARADNQQLHSSPQAGVDSLRSGAAWWNLNESDRKKKKRERHLQWPSTSSWLGEPQGTDGSVWTHLRLALCIQDGCAASVHQMEAVLKQEVMSHFTFHLPPPVSFIPAAPQLMPIACRLRRIMFLCMYVQVWLVPELPPVSESSETILRGVTLSKRAWSRCW